MSSRRRRSTTKVDRISALPDSIICHILSLLPTKLSVTTSILSKRWRPIWKSVHILDFDAESFPDFATFRNFIDSVIVARDPTLTLRSFRIRFGPNYRYDSDDLNRFINTALQQRIQNLELDLLFSNLYHRQKLVPTLRKVFICETLVVLKLRSLIVDHVPHLVHLPSLKSLHLEGTYFQKLLHFMNLLRGCPILEELDTTDVELYHRHDNRWEGEFKGIPNLVRANLYYLIEETFPLAWLHNAKFLCVELV